MLSFKQFFFSLKIALLESTPFQLLLLSIQYPLEIHLIAIAFSHRINCNFLSVLRLLKRKRFKTNTLDLHFVQISGSILLKSYTFYSFKLYHNIIFLHYQGFNYMFIKLYSALRTYILFQPFLK